MSTATMRLRRAGAGGLAAAVIAGTLVATAGSALAWSTPVTVVSAGNPAVLAGGAATDAGDVTVTIPAATTWNVNDSLKFDLSALTGADCTTTTGFVAWTSITPTVAFGTTGTTGTLPTFTATNSTAGACATLGKQTSVTLTFTNNGTAPAGGITLDVAHKVQVGSTVPAVAPGPVPNTINVAVTPNGVAATGSPVTVGTVSNQGISAGTPVAFTPGATGQAVPAVTVKESVPGAISGDYVITFNGATAVDVTNAKATWTGQTTAPTVVAGPAADQVTVKALAATTSTTGAGTLTLSGVTITTGTITAPAEGEAVTAEIANGAMANVGANFNVGRVGGSDRYFTAAALYNLGFPVSAGPTSVIVASGALYPDALSASTLSAATGAGVLLTAPTALSPAAQAALSARSATLKTVFIIGGTGAVSAAVQAQIQALLSSTAVVVRLGGADRYATNELVNSYAVGTGNLSTKQVAVVSTGTNFADALSVSPEVVNQKYGLVLTNPTSLSTTAAAALGNYKAVVIVGGTGAVSANVETQIKALGLTVAYRLAGADRTQTAQQIANWATLGVPATSTYAKQLPLGFTKPIVHVARGDIFADALAAGPVAAKFDSGNGTVILLTNNPTSLGAGAPAYVSGLAGASSGAAMVGTVNGLGLNGAVTTAQLTSVGMAILG